MRLITLIIVIFAIIIWLWDYCVLEKNMVCDKIPNCIYRMVRDNRIFDKFSDIIEEIDMEAKVNEYLGTEESEELFNLLDKFENKDRKKILSSVLELLNITSVTLREELSKVNSSPDVNIEKKVQDALSRVFPWYFNELIKEADSTEELDLLTQSCIDLDKHTSTNLMFVGVDPFISVMEKASNHEELKRGLNYLIDLARSSEQMDYYVIKKGVPELISHCRNIEGFIKNGKILLEISDGMEEFKAKKCECLFFGALPNINVLAVNVYEFRKSALLFKKLIINLSDKDIKEIENMQEEHDRENAAILFGQLFSVPIGYKFFSQLAYSVKKIDEFNKIIQKAIEISEKNDNGVISYLWSRID